MLAELFALLMAVCFISSYLPQFLLTVKTRRVEGISLVSCWIAFAGNLFALLACFAMGSAPVMLIVNNLIFVGLSLIMCWMVWLYRR